MHFEPIEITIVEKSIIIEILFNYLHDFEIKNMGERPRGIIIHHILAHEIMRQQTPITSYLNGYVTVSPNGEFKILGIQCYRSTDIKEDSVIIF